MDILGFNFKILAHNVNGWHNKRYSLYNTYKTEDPDVVLLSEHGVEEEANMKMFGYDVIHKNPTQERYDGAAIGIKRHIKYKRGSVMEESYISVIIETNIGSLEIAAGYQPPRRDYLPVHSLIQLFNKPHPVLLIGDLNARTAVSGYRTYNGIGRSLNTLIDRGIVTRLGPDFPTFFYQQSATKPDIVLSNNIITYNYHIKPGPPTVSDHVPIVMIISTAPIQVEIPPRKSFRKVDWDKYRVLLNSHQQHLDPGSTLEDIDLHLYNLQTALERADNEVIPRIKYKTLQHPANTQETINKLSQLRQVYTTIFINGINRELTLQLRTLKIELNHLLNHQQTSKWNEIIAKTDEETTPKIFWRNIKRLKGEINKKQIILKNRDGEITEDPVVLEEKFRRKWRKIFQISEEEEEDFDDQHDALIKTRMIPLIHRTTPYAVIDNNRFTPLEPAFGMEELTSAIAGTKQRAPGLSGVTKKHLEEAPLRTRVQLLELLNACYNVGYYPDVYKTAKMIFIQKPGKPSTDPLNFRPISLLEYIGKLMEILLNNRLVKFLTTNNLYNNQQHGFRKKRGVDTALTILTEYIAIQKGAKSSIDLALRDVQKAFDKVWIVGLQYKLLHLNLPPLLERILCDYITERKAKIHIEGHTGPTFELKAGVPQGGCLSPTLFIIYTADIPPPLRHTTKDLQYADDVTQIISFPTKSERVIAFHTSREIDRINKYEKKWKIRTNNTKLKIIPISRRKTADVITPNEEHYDYVREGKVLGLTITSSGYTKHFKERTNRALAEIRKIKRFKNLSFKNKRKLYLTLIRPLLTYPVIPTLGASLAQLKKLQRIQNQALRWITRNYTRTTNIIQEIHNSTKIEPLNLYLHRLAVNIWSRLEEELEEEEFRTITEIDDTYRENTRFRRTYPIIQQPITPLYS